MRALLACTLAVLSAFSQFPPGGPTRQPSQPPAQPPLGPGGDQDQRRPQPRTRSATGDALDRYASGEYDRAISSLALLGGFNVQQADVWIKAAGPDAVPRRRLTAATLVLEVVAAKATWPSQVVEWACESFRGPETAPNPPTAGEQLWMRASIALAEGYRVWPFLTAVPFERENPGSSAARPVRASRLMQLATEHLSHVRARFPLDPYVALAEIVVAENLVSEPSAPDAKRTDQTPVSMDRLTAAVDGTPLSTEQRALLDRTAMALEALASNSEVGGEAMLRLGFVRLRQGRFDEALPQFRAVDAATTDVAVRYLARLLEGWTLGRTNQPDAAMASYRAALKLIPRARSASTLLTSLLLRQDRPEEAEAAATDFLQRSPATDDPWRQYMQGDYRSYADLISRLREAIK